MYQSPAAQLAAQNLPVDPRKMQEHYEARPVSQPPSPGARAAPRAAPACLHEQPRRASPSLARRPPPTRGAFRPQDFYEDIFEELAKYGEVENLNICDNLADHLVGNVYVKFKEEESAAAAVAGLGGRYYSGRPIIAEFSPVTDFREATCRQYEENTCARGGYCNFMHLKPISRDLRKILFGRYTKRSRRSRSRSRDRDRRRSRSRSRDRDRDRKARQPRCSRPAAALPGAYSVPDSTL